MGGLYGLSEIALAILKRAKKQSEANDRVRSYTRAVPCGLVRYKAIVAKPKDSNF